MISRIAAAAPTIEAAQTNPTLNSLLFLSVSSSILLLTPTSSRDILHFGLLTAQAGFIIFLFRKPTLKSFCVSFFKKRPPIQRAERWSLVATSETPNRSKAPRGVNFKSRKGFERGEHTSGGSPL